jgi:hypothetical protein
MIACGAAVSLADMDHRIAGSSRHEPDVSGEAAALLAESFGAEAPAPGGFESVHPDTIRDAR